MSTRSVTACHSPPAGCDPHTVRQVPDSSRHVNRITDSPLTGLCLEPDLVAMPRAVRDPRPRRAVDVERVQDVPLLHAIISVK